MEPIAELGIAHTRPSTYLWTVEPRKSSPPIYLNLIFAILQSEISELINWIFLPAVACKIQV